MTWSMSWDSHPWHPAKPLEIKLNHSDGSSHTIKVNHTLNENQIGWFKAGSALNLIKQENQ